MLWPLVKSIPFLSGSCKKPDRESPGRQEWDKRKEYERRLRKIKNELKKTEADINNIDRKIKEMENLMSQPEKISSVGLFAEYAEIKTKHDYLITHWENLHKQIEEFEKINSNK